MNYTNFCNYHKSFFISNIAVPRCLVCHRHILWEYFSWGSDSSFTPHLLYHHSIMYQRHLPKGPFHWNSSSPSSQSVQLYKQYSPWKFSSPHSTIFYLCCMCTLPSEHFPEACPRSSASRGWCPSKLLCSPKIWSLLTGWCRPTTCTWCFGCSKTIPSGYLTMPRTAPLRGSHPVLALVLWSWKGRERGKIHWFYDHN